MEDPAAGKTALYQRIERKDRTPHLKKVQHDLKEKILQASHKRRMQKQRPELQNWSKNPPTQTLIKRTKWNIGLIRSGLQGEMVKEQL